MYENSSDVKYFTNVDTLSAGGSDCGAGRRQPRLHRHQGGPDLIRPRARLRHLRPDQRPDCSTEHHLHSRIRKLRIR